VFKVLKVYKEHLELVLRVPQVLKAVKDSKERKVLLEHRVQLARRALQDLMEHKALKAFKVYKEQ
jgi:hypothetical protein